MRHQELEGIFYCPAGTKVAGRASPGFDRYHTNPVRRTQSFCEDQLLLLHFIVSGIMGGRDLSVVVRNPQFPKLVKKILDMRAKSKAAKARGGP